jgi:hypothetical protein
VLTGISTLCLIAGVYIIYNTTTTGAVQRGRACDPAMHQAHRHSSSLLMMEALLGIIGTLGGYVSSLIKDGS